MHYLLERKDGHAECRLEGLALLEGWERVLPQLGQATAEAGDRTLMILIEGLVGFLGTPERQKVGELAAQHLMHLRKVALLVPPQKLTGVTQRAAREHGLDLRVFDDAAQALAWLAD
jgi:hypothetical protein